MIIRDPHRNETMKEGKMGPPRGIHRKGPYYKGKGRHGVVHLLNNHHSMAVPRDVVDGKISLQVSNLVGRRHRISGIHVVVERQVHTPIDVTNHEPSPASLPPNINILTVNVITLSPYLITLQANK